MFKVNQKVICVDNSMRPEVIFEVSLTKGKAYEVLDVHTLIDDSNRYSIGVIDDMNYEKGYLSERSISLKEYRKQKIKRCLRQEII